MHDETAYQLAQALNNHRHTSDRLIEAIRVDCTSREMHAEALRSNTTALTQHTEALYEINRTLKLFMGTEHTEGQADLFRGVVHQLSNAVADFDRSTKLIASN